MNNNLDDQLFLALGNPIIKSIEMLLQTIVGIYRGCTNANNSTFHSKTRHIHLKYHLIRSILEDELLKLEKIHTSQNPTNMLTKVETGEKLSYFLFSISLQT